jgi:phosphoribosyl-ATP pyrophosphohydrolase/phosphoribosyl-AMP cyclohydrolase
MPPTPSTLPLKFDAQGLVSVVVQDHLTGEVRMCAFANAEAIAKTLQTGRATFWSRSRNELWEKGLKSGNTIQVVRVLVDCDADCVVYAAEPLGPSCHTGAVSCFFRSIDPGKRDALIPAMESPQTALATLEATLEERKKSTAGTSYTKSLYDAGAPKIGAKLREEAGELAQAIESESDERVASEAADVIYHLMVGLRWRSVPFRKVLGELARRIGKSGHEEKAARKPAQ